MEMMRPILLLIFLLFAAVPLQSREAEAAWARERGISEGVLVERSESPDGRYALFEFHRWEGGVAAGETTVTGIGLAPMDRSRLLFVIDSRTKWMTDRNVTSFLDALWNPPSTLLATHDSGAKHSRLNLYKISETGSASALEIPDLLSVGAAKLGIAAGAVKSSGQIPLRWIDEATLEVNVRMTTPEETLAVKVPLHIDACGHASAQ